MKKILILFLILLFGNFSPAADLDQVLADNEVLTANITFDWLDVSQAERDTAIAKYQTELFPEDTVYKYNRKDFKSEYKDFLKDSDYKRHYMLVSNNVRETNDENLCGFYRGKILMSYAVQYKNDLRTIYYYDAFGNLRYVDKCSGNYPNYPYTSKQYRANGTLISAIYFVSHDIQYMFDDDQSFKGVWYKDKMFNKKAKQTLTRTNW